jgi:hypothetical protein
LGQELINLREKIVNHQKMWALSYRLVLVGALLLLSSTTVYPQRASALAGRWIWKEVARRNRPQTQFTLVINHKGEVVSGTYSVDEFINGKWQGEDGNQTPFIGKVKGATVVVEFDPTATVAGYEQNVTYARPTGGRKPSTAVITIVGPTLQWRHGRGARIEGLPVKLTLTREPLKKLSKRTRLKGTE